MLNLVSETTVIVPEKLDSSEIKSYVPSPLSVIVIYSVVVVHRAVADT